MYLCLKKHLHAFLDTKLQKKKSQLSSAAVKYGLHNQREQYTSQIYV
jgi:hypothetical protein